MRKKLSVGMLAVVGLVCVSSISSAATLDDVMARLDRLQRHNEAMRKEIAALRRKEERSIAILMPWALATRPAAHCRRPRHRQWRPIL